MKPTRKTALIAGLAFAAFASAASADLQLFGREDFRGRQFEVQGSVDNLDETGFNDRASSAIVRGGPWLVCSDAHFRGRCVTLRPGDYPSLASMGLADNISSARQLRGERYGGERYGGERYGGERDTYHGSSRVTLYEGPNFRGESLVIDREQFRNLEPLGFNDRTTSVRVEGAPWVLCSDAHFEGSCRTFNPGEYARLPEDLNNRISSGHRANEPYASGRRN